MSDKILFSAIPDRTATKFLESSIFEESNRNIKALKDVNDRNFPVKIINNKKYFSPSDIKDNSEKIQFLRENYIVIVPSNIVVSKFKLKIRRQDPSIKFPIKEKRKDSNTYMVEGIDVNPQPIDFSTWAINHDREIRGFIDGISDNSSSDNTQQEEG